MSGLYSVFRNIRRACRTTTCVNLMTTSHSLNPPNHETPHSHPIHPYPYITPPQTHHTDTTRLYGSHRRRHTEPQYHEYEQLIRPAKFLFKLQPRAGHAGSRAAAEGEWREVGIN